jgi:tight adherence protein B
VLAGLLAFALAGSRPASAEPGRIDVRVTELAPTGPASARATVAVSGPAVEGRQLPADAFTATAGGGPAPVTGVTPPGAARTPVSVLLVIDTSGSMGQSGDIERAKVAADRFVDQLRPGGRIGVVRFSNQPETVRPLTADAAAAKASIATLRANGDTALNDAVLAAVDQLPNAPGQRVVVLLSDGADNRSAHTVEDAIAAAKRAKAVVYTVGLDNGLTPAPVLTRLAAETGGKFVKAQGARLADLYASLGRELYSQYVVDFRVPPGTPSETQVVVTVAVGGARGSSEGRVLLLPASPGQAPGLDQQPATGLTRLQTRQGLYLIAALMFVAVLLFGYALMATPPGSGKSYRELRQRLSQYSLTPTIDDEAPRAGGFGSGDLAGRVTGMAESLVRRGNLEEEFLSRIELAGLKLRVAEFVLISLASAFGFPLLLLLLTRNLPVTVAGVAVGVLAPFLFLVVKTARRQARFEEQLPDTLQLLGGALQAGHSLLQAVDTVVKEADEPMSVEFQRVLTEARLGMPLEEALDGVAKRMNSQDFEWTVMAVSLQRQIGGNLAELLNTVASTIRERYTLKRQIRALSAEGRLSSIILSVLPFLMFFVLLAFNPTFLAPLYTTPLGLAMLSSAAILMIVGILWMKKITNIEV